MTELKIKTEKGQKFTDITAQINKLIKEKEVNEGICVIFVPHTTAAVTINENADPDMLTDLYNTFNRNFPKLPDYSDEGNSDAHFKSLITGPSLTCIIDKGKLALGIWQNIYFCEFDGPKTRKIYVKIISD